MNTKTMIVIAALMAAPLAAAHFPSVPDTSCNSSALVHDYGLPGSVDASVDDPTDPGSTIAPGVGVMSPQDGNLADCDGDGIPADYDGDTEYGVGGGSFPDNHHDSTFCVSDAVWGSDVGIVVGADGNDDGLIVPDVEPSDALTAAALGCATATFGAGADGTWKVFLSGVFASLTPGFPATMGHIS